MKFGINIYYNLLDCRLWISFVEAMDIHKKNSRIMLAKKVIFYCNNNNSNNNKKRLLST